MGDVVLTTAVARRYARAFFQAALGADELEQAFADIEVLTSVVADKQVSAWLLDPRAGESRKRDALLRAMKDTGRHFVNLLNMLERRNRLAVLTQLPAAFLVLHGEHHGRQRGLLETALPLIEGEKEALEASFSASTGKQVSLEVRQDASLLGGVRVTLAGTRYDGTARARLNAARKRLQEVELNIG